MKITTEHTLTLTDTELTGIAAILRSGASYAVIADLGLEDVLDKMPKVGLRGLDGSYPKKYLGVSYESYEVIITG